jgi:hypothetical protein
MTSLCVVDRISKYVMRIGDEFDDFCLTGQGHA